MKAIDRTGIDYYCQVSDVELIKKLVRMLPENPICVNIGAGLGTSALSMLEARPDSCVISIDIEDCPEESKVIYDAFGEMVNGRYQFLKGKSQDIGMSWKGVVDLVFVDGGHKYNECYDDAIEWYDSLRHGGIMAFHDYESPIRVLGCVKTAVDDVSTVLGLKRIAREGTLIAFRKV